jgi:S-(hydroxymethyl)mycothiol dehydrogenase
VYDAAACNPELVDIYLQGRLPLQRFRTEPIAVTDIDRAFQRMHSGEVLRSVVIP